VISCPAGSLVWASDPVRPAGSSPATWAELDPTQKKSKIKNQNIKKKIAKISKKFVIFPYIVYQFGIILVCIFTL